MNCRLFTVLITAFCLLTAACCPPETGPWHPERTDYPRTLYRADQIDAISARLDRYPYDVLYGRVLNRAASTPNLTPGPPYNPGREYSNANIAKACAFVFAMEGGQAYLDKAVQILEAIDTELEPLTIDLIQDDIHIAEALTVFCQAFDILLGTGALPEVDRSSIEDRIAALTENFFCTWASTLCSNYVLRSNHHTKMATTVGMAAIVLNQHPMASVWIDYAMTQTAWDLDFLTTADGGYAEGPSYWVYSAVNVLPFAWAYRTFTDGEGEFFVDRPCNLVGLGQVGDEIWVDDLFVDPTLRSISDWLIRIRQPDGTTPPFDDSNTYAYFNGMLTGVYEDGFHAWDWLTATAKPLHSSYCADLTVDLICSFDDSVPVVEPTWPPTQFLPEAGNAVLRGGWGTDDTYVLFLAENGKARIQGYGHEHPDGLSFHMVARGETLAMDSGYIRWEDHDLVRHARNHNLVLIDGKGAPTPTPIGGLNADAFLDYFFTTSFLDYCSGRTEHNQATHARALIFPRKRYLVVADELRGWYRAHDYQWLLHGNGGGSTGGTFAPTADGGLWTIGDARLAAAVTTTDAAPTLRSYDDWHGFVWSQAETHTVLEASAPGRNTRFLAVLVPASMDEVLPEITIGPDGAGTAVAIVVEPDRTGATYLRAPDLAGEPWTAESPAGHPEIPSISTDADLLFQTVESGGCLLREFYGRDFTIAGLGGLAVARLEPAASLALQFETGVVEGHLASDDPCTLTLWTIGPPSAVTGESVTGYEYLGEGFTRIDFSGAGGFEVVLEKNPQKARLIDAAVAVVIDAVVRNLYGPVVAVAVLVDAVAGVLRPGMNLQVPVIAVEVAEPSVLIDV